MSKFEDCIIANYGRYDFNSFKINLSKKKVFVCGGPVLDEKVDASFRQRFVIGSSNKIDVVLAESFKDYFKDNTYSDLLVFEDDIATISSMIVIFLESPGSFVELGMFIARPVFYSKILIVAPHEETKEQDSFIYLGPLEHIRKKYNDSVVIYPWPKCGESYDKDHIDDLITVLERKIASQGLTKKFDLNDIGHISFLIAEIIRLSYPIILDEIELALYALNIDINQSRVKSLLYLLINLEYINFYEYSRYKYYYPIKKHSKIPFVSFGSDKNKIPFNESNFLLSIRQSYLVNNTEQDKKRQAANREIGKILG